MAAAWIKDDDGHSGQRCSDLWPLSALNRAVAMLKLRGFQGKRRTFGGADLGMKMCLALVCALALSSGAAAGPVRDFSAPMVAVAGYDKARLIGDWFDVARSKNMLEADCYGVTTDIAGREDSRLTLKIACHKGRLDGPVVPNEGVMVEVAQGQYQLRLMRLAELGNLEMAVLWAAPDDSMVVIGPVWGQVGWVLAKVPEPDGAALDAGIQVLVDNGYAPRAIAPVEQ
jgi:lipocalin